MANALNLTAGLQHQGYYNSGSNSNHSIDASGEGIAWVFQSETTDPITGAWFRYNLRTGTPPTYRISLQLPNSGGIPDGVVLGSGSPASANFTPPADTSWDGLGQWVTFDNSYTPTLGQTIACVIEYASGTIDVSNFSSFTRVTTSNDYILAIPYGITNAGGTWTKQQGGVAFGYRTASNKYGHLGFSAYTTTTNTIGRRYAAKINLPTTFGGSTFRVAGLVLFGVVGSAGGTIRFGIWDAAGTELATTGDFDSDHQGSVTNVSNWDIVFTSQPDLNYGTDYYFGVQCVTSNSINIRGVNLTEDDDRLAFPLGTSKTLSLWDGAAWGDISNVVPFVDLKLADITPASSGNSTTTIICRR